MQAERLALYRLTARVLDQLTEQVKTLVNRWLFKAMRLVFRVDSGL
jgi:hypothetical protein